MSSQSWPFSFCSSLRARLKFTAHSRAGSKKSSATATNPSEKSAGKRHAYGKHQAYGRRPSFYAMGASLALLTSALLSLSGEEVSPAEPGPVEDLLARGWLWTDHLGCDGLRAGSFYELESDSAATELLFLGAEKILAARLPLPETPYRCREIPEPHFIQEIE